MKAGNVGQECMTVADQKREHIMRKTIALFNFLGLNIIPRPKATKPSK